MLTEEKLTKLAIEAMKENAPQMYQSLVKSGDLLTVARSRAIAALETEHEIRNQAMEEAQKISDPMEKIQFRMQTNLQAERAALQQLAEFPPEDENFIADM